MKNSVFNGVCVAEVTPFKDNKIDYNALEKLIEYQIKNGVSAISILGTTGEPCTLNLEEKQEILSFCVKKVAKRVKLLVGSGGNNTSEVLKFSEYAAQNGADALLVVTPYYNKCTQKGLIGYYNSIAQISKIPIIAYNVPTRTGVNILPKTLGQIIKNKYIVGFKQASNNIAETIEIFKKYGKKIDIYSGEDELNYLFYCLGGSGAISVTANAFPKEVCDVYNYFKKGDLKNSLKSQEKLYDLNKALFTEVNPIPIKQCLANLGFCNSDVRPPLTKATISKKYLKKCTI